MRVGRACVAVALILLLAVGSTIATDLSGQAVTWADFGFVNRVTASLSYVYFATSEGILRYDKIKDTWLDPLTGTSAPPDEEILDIKVDRFDKRLYAETRTGVWEYNFFLDRWYTVTEMPSVDNDVTHMSAPATLLAPPGFNYSDAGFLIDPYGRRFEITTVANDGEGNLWMGTWGYGPLEATATSKFVSLLPYGLLQNRVNAIEEVDGVYYVGGAYFDDYRTGITIYDYDANTFDYIEAGVVTDFPRTDVNCIEHAGDRLLIGTPFGLYRYNLDAKRFEGKLDRRSGLSHDNVLSALANGDSVFVGTEDGLTLLTQRGDSAELVWPKEFVGRRVYDFELVGDDVWIASSAGAYRIKLTTGELQKYQDPTGVLFSDVYDISLADEFLWLLADNGVVQLNLKTGDSAPFREVFPRSRPSAVAANDSICAVASDAGLTLIYHTVESPFSRTFTVDDGLASNYAFSLDLFGDYIWVGTQDGLTLFWWNNPNRVD